MPTDEEDVLGQTIVKIRPMTKAELKKEGWEDHNNPGPALVLGNGAVLYPSQDDEGNGPGAMFYAKAGKTYWLGVS